MNETKKPSTALVAAVAIIVLLLVIVGTFAYTYNTESLANQTLRGELHSQNSTIKNQVYSINQLEGIMEMDQLRMAQLNTTISSDNSSIANLSMHIAELKGNIAQDNVTINSDNLMISKLQTEMIALNATISTDQNEITILSGENTNNTKEIQSLEANITADQNIIANDNAKITQLNNNITALNEQISSLNLEVSSLDSEISSLQSQISSLDSEIGGLESSVSTLSYELNVANTQLSSLLMGFPEVVNTNITVTNDLDGGDYGYWALDNFTAHVQLWQVSSNEASNGSAEPPYSFLVSVYIYGTESTYYGAVQPNGASASYLEPGNANGTIYGGILEFGTASHIPTFPSSYNAKGTVSTILEGTYAKQGNPSGFFTDVIYSQFTSNIGNDWSFTYIYGNQVMRSSSYSTIGNIVAFPQGAKQVMSISMNVINDEDSGMVGYWALDNYTKTVTVWQEPNGIYYANVTYSGTFTTYDGALSPQNGVKETQTVTGTFTGGYVATFTGTLNANMQLNGYIGSYNFGGTVTDILKGMYNNGQTGATNAYDWLTAYFGNSALNSFTEASWGWTYQYENQIWINTGAITGNSGDIVV